MLNSVTQGSRPNLSPLLCISFRAELHIGLRVITSENEINLSSLSIFPSMCGIVCLHVDSGIVDELVRKRGPNSWGRCGVGSVRFGGAVLHIQGNAPQAQPVEDTDGNLFLWNGEVFGGLDVPPGESDTTTVMRVLGVAIKGVAEAETETEAAATAGTHESAGGVARAIAGVLTAIQGPFAMMFYHAASATLFFARDPIGRRSLMLVTTARGAVVGVSSVNPLPVPAAADHESDCSSGGARAYSLVEIEPAGVYSLGLSVAASSAPAGDPVLSPGPPVLHPWSPGSVLRLGEGIDAHEGGPGAGCGAVVGGGMLRRTLTDCSAVLLGALDEAVRRRVVPVCAAHAHVSSSSSSSSLASAPVGVLFSGGVDSAILACLLDHHVTVGLPIDLINVAFLGPTGVGMDGPLGSPDRLSAIVAWRNIQSTFPLRCWRLVHVDVPQTDRFACEPLVRRLIAPCDTHMDLNIGLAFWFGSGGRGYVRAYSEQEVASLYSVCQNGRPLLRVGAEGYRASRGEMGVDETCVGVPVAVPEPEPEPVSEPVLVSVPTVPPVPVPNVPPVPVPVPVPVPIADEWADKERREQKQKRQQKKKGKKKDAQLCNNGQGCQGGSGSGLDVEQWRAALSEGGLLSQDYVSAARALLVGIGADEQLAGYGRHRTRWAVGGDAALAEELAKDQVRATPCSLDAD